MTQKFQVAAREKSGMTLGEIEQFVRQAADAGAPPDSRLEVVTTWKGGLKTLSVEFSGTKPGSVASLPEPRSSGRGSPPSFPPPSPR